MASFRTLLILILQAKLAMEQVSLSPGAKIVKIANFFHQRSYRLAVSPLASLELADELKCLTSCVKTDECYCVNTKKQGNKNVMCELLNRTMYQYPKNLTKDASSSHWYKKVLSSCVPDPCEIYAACQVKETMGFTCVYKKNYNFALLKPTAQSDTLSGGIGSYSSHYAVDGIKASSCSATGVPACAHLYSGHNQWWRVDLQIIVPVARVRITNRKDYLNGLKNFEIKIGNSLENEGRNNPKCGERHSVPHKEAKVITCSPTMPGRYVVIQGFDSHALVLIEVEVFAAGLVVE